MPGWQGSDRRERLPADWHITQPRILERDRHQCRHVRSDTGRECGAHARQVDHRVPGDDHSDANLFAICDWHHAQKSGREGGTASGKARRAKRDEAKPQHPGVMENPRRRKPPETPPPF